jgi:hypothetical protein
MKDMFYLDWKEEFVMNKLVTLKDGTEIYKVTVLIFGKNIAEVWIDGKNEPEKIPIEKIYTIS